MDNYNTRHESQLNELRQEKAPATDKKMNEIPILEIRPSKTISQEDRLKLRSVLNIINKHLPDGMFTENPF